MLSETWSRVLRGRLPPIDDDRRAHAGDGAAFCSIAREVEFHAAMNDLRIIEYLVETVDRPRRHLLGFKFFKQLVALHARGYSG